jgi:hypothetical protein
MVADCGNLGAKQYLKAWSSSQETTTFSGPHCISNVNIKEIRHGRLEWAFATNGVTKRRRIGEYPKRRPWAPIMNMTTVGRGYMAPRQYRLKKGHVEYKTRNVRTIIQFFIIDIVDFKPHCWNLIHCCEKSHPYINFYQARPHMYSTKYSNEEYGKYGIKNW